MISFKDFLLEHAFQDTVWLVGRPEGHKIGLHNSIWGTLDADEAKDYSTSFGKQKGNIYKYKLTPTAKVLDINGDKINLMSKLWNWTPQQEQYVRQEMRKSDHRPAIQLMGDEPQQSNSTSAPEGWRLTQMDTLLTQKLLGSGVDAAVMRKEWKGTIVVVNPKVFIQVSD